MAACIVHMSPDSGNGNSIIDWRHSRSTSIGSVGFVSRDRISFSIASQFLTINISRDINCPSHSVACRVTHQYHVRDIGVNFSHALQGSTIYFSIQFFPLFLYLPLPLASAYTFRLHFWSLGRVLGKAPAKCDFHASYFASQKLTCKSLNPNHSIFLKN